VNNYLKKIEDARAATDKVQADLEEKVLELASIKKENSDNLAAKQGELKDLESEIAIEKETITRYETKKAEQLEILKATKEKVADQEEENAKAEEDFNKEMKEIKEKFESKKAELQEDFNSKMRAQTQNQ